MNMMVGAVACTMVEGNLGWLLRTRLATALHVDSSSFGAAPCAMGWTRAGLVSTHTASTSPESAKGPTYVGGRLGFCPRFMVTVIRCCIDGFEVVALSAGRDPAPPARGCIELHLDDEV